MLLAGVDIGTTSLCAVLYDSDTKTILQTVSAANQAVCPGEVWERMQDPNALLETVRSLLWRLQETGIPQGIGVTGQMHGILFVNALGKAVSPLYTWQDERGNTPIGSGKTFAEELSEQLGCQVYSGFGICTYTWMLQNDCVPQEAVAICTIGDYIAMRLAGAAEPVMDCTNAASLGAFDVKNGEFYVAALENAGINTRLLPRLVPSGSKLAGTGGIPVVCACGDNQASFLGAVPDPLHDIALNIGTGSQVSLYAEEYFPGKTEIRPFFNSGYLYVGSSLNGGSAYAALARFFAACRREFAPDTEATESVYEVMKRLSAQGEVGSPQVRPLLFGTRTGGTAVYGSVSGLTADNLTPGHLIHGFEAGVIRELFELYDDMPIMLRTNRKRLALSGNGLRKNPGLVRAATECFGLPSQLSEAEEEAALGAALCAAYGCGAANENRSLFFS